MQLPADNYNRENYPVRRLFIAAAFVALLVTGLVAETLNHSKFNQRAPMPGPVDTVELPDASFLDLASLIAAEETKPVKATLRRGQALPEALIKAGADRSDAHLAIQALFDAELIDPRRLQIGLTTNLVLGENTNSGKAVKALTLGIEPGRQLLVKRLNDDFVALPLDAKLAPVYHRVTAPIETSLYETARKLGAEDQQIVDFASAFAYDIDFQREIYPGDAFEMVFPTWQDERGRIIKSGELAYAELRGLRKTKAYYRHTPSDDGISGWFDRSGESATRFLMKTPINGARLSSSFGRRRHPISGYTRMHKGTDFAARTGTPVYAAGNGVIERASRYGGYGNYVRIRHANGYKTAYAHLSRYGRGAKKGRRVRQGDIIGYVGSTGASTGPHLHYEVMVGGKHVNPMSLDLPTGRKLADSEGMLAEFEAKQRKIDQIRYLHGAKNEENSGLTETLSN